MRKLTPPPPHPTPHPQLTVQSLRLRFLLVTHIADCLLKMTATACGRDLHLLHAKCLHVYNQSKQKYVAFMVQKKD